MEDKNNKIIMSVQIKDWEKAIELLKNVPKDEIEKIKVYDLNLLHVAAVHKLGLVNEMRPHDTVSCCESEI